MIVCHCRAVSDHQVRAAIECGADDRDDVTARCGAGGDCGGCHRRIDQLLGHDRAERSVLLRIAS